MKIRMLTAIAASALCLTAFSSAEAGGRKGGGGHGGACENGDCGGAGRHGGKHGSYEKRDGYDRHDRDGRRDRYGKHDRDRHHSYKRHSRRDRDNDRDDRKDFLGPAYGLGFTIYGYPGGYGAYNLAGTNLAGYCAQRYRSFDPASGTFMGYDGVRRVCRMPY